LVDIETSTRKMRIKTLIKYLTSPGALWQ